MKIRLDITEKQFESQVKDLARLYGWFYYHTWRSIHSPAGFPDCCMVKPPRIVFAELKSEKGKLSDIQKAWINILSECGGNIEVYVWRPSDFDEIVDILETSNV